MHIPSNAENGDYKLALWFPDAYESLRDNPFYAIQFANENVWDEAAGLNVLGNVSITASAGGEFERGNEFRVISAESQTIRDIPSSIIDSVEAPTTTRVSSSADLINNPVVENDVDNLMVQFEFSGDVTAYNGFQILLDVDQDPKTGMSIAGIGADFLLENDTLNTYAGSGSDWKWAPVEAELSFSNEDQIAKWTLSRVALGDSANFDIVFQLVDTNWDTVFATNKLTHILK